MHWWLLYLLSVQIIQIVTNLAVPMPGRKRSREEPSDPSASTKRSREEARNYGGHRQRLRNAALALPIPNPPVSEPMTSRKRKREVMDPEEPHYGGGHIQ